MTQSEFITDSDKESVDTFLHFIVSNQRSGSNATNDKSVNYLIVKSTIIAAFSRGSLCNKDGDVSENGKKEIGLY